MPDARHEPFDDDPPAVRPAGAAADAEVGGHPPASPRALGAPVHQRGYHGVSMHDIATTANLTKGALYGHFRSKGQLLVEVLRWKLAERDHAPGFLEAAAHPEVGVALMYGEDGRDIRLLEVDAAAAARHDPDVAAGLADLARERHERIRDAMAEARDPDTAAWLVEALSQGIGIKESSGLPLPDADRLHDTISPRCAACSDAAIGGRAMATVDFRTRYEGDTVDLDPTRSSRPAAPAARGQRRRRRARRGAAWRCVR